LINFLETFCKGDGSILFEQFSFGKSKCIIFNLGLHGKYEITIRLTFVVNDVLTLRLNNPVDKICLYDEAFFGLKIVTQIHD